MANDASKAGEAYIQIRAELDKLDGDLAKGKEKTAAAFKDVVADATGKVEGFASVFEKTLGGGALGTLGGALGIGASVSLFDDLAARARDARKEAIALGGTITEIRGLKMFAREDWDALQTGLMRMNHALGDAVMGSKESQQHFAKIGLDWARLANQGPVENLKEVMNALRGMSLQEQMLSLDKLLGRGAGRELLPLINQSADVIDKFQDRAKGMAAWDEALQRHAAGWKIVKETVQGALGQAANYLANPIRATHDARTDAQKAKENAEIDAIIKRQEAGAGDKGLGERIGDKIEDVLTQGRVARRKAELQAQAQAGEDPILDLWRQEDEAAEKAKTIAETRARAVQDELDGEIAKLRERNQAIEDGEHKEAAAVNRKIAELRRRGATDEQLAPLQAEAERAAALRVDEIINKQIDDLEKKNYILQHGADNWALVEAMNKGASEEQLSLLDDLLAYNKELTQTKKDWEEAEAIIKRTAGHEGQMERVWELFFQGMLTEAQAADAIAALEPKGKGSSYVGLADMFKSIQIGLLGDDSMKDIAKQQLGVQEKIKDGFDALPKDIADEIMKNPMPGVFV